MPDAPEEAAAPLTAEELDRLAQAAFGGLASAVLAVSGGPDSLMLLVLARRWRGAVGARAPVVHVATVDHCLRADSAREAAWVAGRAATAGFPHHTLVWEGDKPATGRMAAAREARYGSLAGLVERLCLPKPAAIVVAHHLDDQAETLLMRLARGSGLDGLAAMPSSQPLTGQERGCSFLGPPLSDAIRLVRPFLEQPKARLVATLRALGLDWLEDPSNANVDFERVRVRKALATLAGLGITGDALGTSARRLLRARSALEAMTDDAARRALDVHGGAWASIDAAIFSAAPLEIRLRLLQRLIRWFGAPGEPPRMTRLEALADRLAGGAAATATLGGCQFQRSSDRFTAVREPGRRGLPELMLAPGETRLWDGRFIVGAGPERARPVTVKALPGAVLTAIKLAGLQSRARFGDVPRQAMLALPSFWEGPELVAVPHPCLAGFAGTAAGGSAAGLSARFIAD